MMRYIKLFLIAVSLLVSCQSFAKEDVKLPYKDFKPFKMVFLPDTHLSFKDNDDGPILYKESLVILQDVIRSLNQTQNPDFVVFGGNLTNNDDAELADMPMFLDTIADLNAKYYAILGDKEAAVKEEFIKDFDEFGSQTFWTAEPEENVLLVGLDTSIKGEEDGYVNIHQLFWLDNVLKNNRDKFTIITMHHSPHLSLEKSDLFLELINLYPQVKVVLSGHNRINLVKKDNGKLFINCPSIVSYPNEYKILNIYPDRVEVDNKKISFKQIIKKAKKLIGKDYKKPDKFSKKSKYYF